METKICTKCHQAKDLAEFRIRHSQNGYRESQCRTCLNQKVYDWRKRNHYKHKKYDRDYKREYLKTEPLKRRCHNIRRSAIQHAKSLNVPMELTESDIKSMYDSQNGNCFYTGLRMKTEGNTDRDLMIMSCDRIDSTKGYIEGNVVLCCWGMNLLKGRHTPDVLYSTLQSFYDGAKLLGKIKNPEPKPGAMTEPEG